MVNGKTIICMDMENYIIQTIKQLTKDNGLLINSMGKVKFIMMSLFKCRDFSIIQTLISYNKDGNIIKETQFVIQNKDKENSSYLMINIMKVSLEMIKQMVRVNL